MFLNEDPVVISNVITQYRVDIAWRDTALRGSLRIA